MNVDYFERLGRDEYCLAHVVAHRQQLFFEKCLDWRDESEYRWVIYGSENVDLFLDFGSALSSIVFGASCAESDVSKVVGLRKGKQTWFEQLVWHGPTPWVTFNFGWPESTDV